MPRHTRELLVVGFTPNEELWEAGFSIEVETADEDLPVLEIE